MVTDILYDLADPLFVVRHFTVLHVFAKQVAQYSAEVFMAWERQKTTGIGKHSDEFTDQPDVAERIDLFRHSIFLVEEPP